METFYPVQVKIVSSSASTQEKTLIPKSRPSTPELARKRKLTPTKTSQQPAKVTKIEPKPAPSYQNTHHNELLIRLSFNMIDKLGKQLTGLLSNKIIAIDQFTS